MIAALGGFLWIVAISAVIRVAALTIFRPRPRLGRWFWLCLCLAAAALFFRPHEDIFGGEDPGAYINAGVTYGRLQKFFYVDPLLSQVPVEVRSNFYYGHAGYGTTKDACLWVRDQAQALIGPHFQPAYPLLIGLVTPLCGPEAGILVVPLFALFAALALGTLAGQLLPHRLAAPIAFLCYALNPLTIWHGRCARPEIIAAFMFFGGCALLLHVLRQANHSWRVASWKRWPDILLGAVCVSLAPFFHITAWLLVIPLAVALAVIIAGGRDDFLIYPVVAAVAFAGFICQVVFVTEYYGIRRFLEPLIRHPFPFILLFLAGLALLGWFSRRQKARQKRESPGEDQPPEYASVRLGIAFAVATGLFFIVAFLWRDAAGSLPLLGRPIEHYLYLTDFRTLVNMVSRPLALLALAGWIVWATGPAMFRRDRLALALVLFPALILAGNMRDFMMTRYLMIAIIPVGALCLTALATLIPENRQPAPAPSGIRLAGRRAWIMLVAPLLAALIWFIGMHGRAHLVTITEHKGWTRFLSGFAETIGKENGMLLCEYSRIAATLEHFFGIPTLGLDNERQDDYTKAEQAWAQIMRANPDRPAFFMTPFHRPVSDLFAFELIRQGEHSDQKLQQARQSLPTVVKSGKTSLTLYRMRLKPAPDSRPYVAAGGVQDLPFDPGNMGLRHFANLRTAGGEIAGMNLTADDAAFFNLALPPETTVSEVICLMLADKNQPVAPTLQSSIATNTIVTEFVGLTGNWWLFRLRSSNLVANTSFSIVPREPLFLADVVVVTADNALSLFKQFPAPKITRRRIMPLQARWARAEAEMLLPAPPEKPWTLLMLVYAPKARLDGQACLNIGTDAANHAQKIWLEPDVWRWLALRFGPGPANEDARRVTLRVNPAWNPEKAGFPSDLGMLVGKVVVVPAPGLCHFPVAIPASLSGR